MQAAVSFLKFIGEKVEHVYSAVVSVELILRIVFESRLTVDRNYC